MEQIRIAQIGTKHDHAACSFRTLRALPRQFEVLGWYEPDPEARRLAQAKPEYQGIPSLTEEELFSLPGLQAVSVETEESLLTEWSLRAAERGLHIHMDKPGSPELRQFCRLAHTCEEKDLIFQLGYMYRYNPAVLRALTLWKSGALGEIISIEADMGCLHPTEKRAWLGQYPGGMMYFLGCHLADLAYLFQGRPCQVLPLSTATGLDGVDAEDYGCAVLRYPHGVTILRTSAAEVNGFSRRQLVICGSKATLEINPLEWYDGSGTADMLTCTLAESYRSDAESMGWQDCRKIRKYPSFQRYEAMLTDFAAMVRGEHKPLYTPAYEIEVQRLVLDCCGVAYQA